MIEDLRKQLQDAAEPEYRDFNQSLVPGISNMLGIRMPVLRDIAKKAAKGDWKKLWKQLSCEQYEELMIKGMLIGYGKLTQPEQTDYLKAFIPSINSWAVCDCCCSTWKFMQKDPEFWFLFLKPYFQSEKEYEVRFAVVAVLDHFITEAYLPEIFQHFDAIENDAYYVQMAVAWAVSVCYVKYPQETWSYLCNDRLDAFTHNKAIQKIRESYRVSKEEKERLLTLKKKKD